MHHRLVYIDLLRAYSIFLVTGFHIWRYIEKPSYQIFGIYDLSSVFSRGYWGVILFFMISGYSMSLITKNQIISSNFNWKNYLLKRLYRIIPAYYFAIFIWSVLVYNGIAVKPIGMFDQITHLLFIHSFFKDTYYSISGVFWSLAIEMQFYFILPFIIVFIIKKPFLSICIALIPIMYSTFVSFNFYISKGFFAYLIYFQKI